MSKKFTGITSAGSAIPVYDKDAHSALEQKLDKSAFSSVSGEFATVDDVVAAVSGKADTSAIPSLDGYATQEWVGEQGYLTEVPESAVSGFATHEEVESATSGKADTSGVVEYANKPSANAIYADGHTLANVGQIVGSGNFYIVPSGVLAVPKIITATTDGLTAAGLSSVPNSSRGGFTANGITANAYLSGFSANGIFAGKKGPLWIQGETEIMSAYGGAGFTFSSVNTGFGTAQLTTANGNTIVNSYSPKFEARNSAGAGFSIEASGAKGYDHAGNVTWDTSVVPPANNLIGYNDTKASSGGLNSNIILTVYGKSNTSIPLSSAPYTILDSYGLTASYGPSANVPSIQIKPDDITTQISTGNSARARFGIQVGGVKYETSAGTWSLTGSVQKREIACDSATSAITAIAGSAIGGKEYSAGANIDITDEVISGKDWSEDIAGATSGLMQTSGLEYDGDKISGYMGSAFKAGDELPSGVMVESAVEYNAVNEISGYNGSAIAQYGAEKQWLVHDDTLVHAANSAQYALGVNLSAVAQLLGVDETLLYSGNAFRVSNGGSFNVTTALSENVSSFNKIVFRMSNGGIDTSEIVCTPVSNGVMFNRIFSYGGQWVGISGAITGNGMSANIGGGNGNNATTCHTAGNWWDYVRVESIYGIGRKA